MTKPGPTTLDIAKATLLAPSGLDESSLQSVFGTILAHKADDADLYFQYNRSEGWTLEEGEVKNGSYSIDQGVGVRVVSGEKTAFAYADDITTEALDSAARVTRAIAAAGGSQKVAAPKVREGRGLYAPIDPVSSLDDAQKVRILETIEQFARSLDDADVGLLAAALMLQAGLPLNADRYRTPIEGNYSSNGLAAIRDCTAVWPLSLSVRNVCPST
jgi:TldD protein